MEIMDIEWGGPSIERQSLDTESPSYLRQRSIRRIIRGQERDRRDASMLVFQSNLAKSAVANAPESHPPFVPLHQEGMKRDPVLRALRNDLVRKKRLERLAKSQLRRTYKQLNKEWTQHCSFLDQIDSMKDTDFVRSHPLYGDRNIANRASDIPNGNREAPAHAGGNDQDQYPLLGHTQQDDSGNITGFTRSNRRNTQSGGISSFGDAVRSEAEFLEILASLESADMQDPSMRAARTTAVVPDMVINVSARAKDLHATASTIFHDDNGFVANPLDFYLSDFDPDYWSAEDKIIFEKRYALYPKQFGKIASGLENKTTSQCVAYYYATKKTTDYKSMLNVKYRDRRRKTKMLKPKKGRGSALMADLKAVATVDEVAVDEDELPAQGLYLEDAATCNFKRLPRNPNRDKRLHQLDKKKPNYLLRNDEGSNPEKNLTANDTDTERRDAEKTMRTAPTRTTTSSYWSIAERTAFLRSLATYGRDWDALANNLTTKSAAQARNFFVRNAEDADFVEAVQLAHTHENATIEERSAVADAFVQRRSSQQHLPESLPDSEPQNGRLNINSLLNTDVQNFKSARPASISEWFGTSVQHELHSPQSETNDRPARRGTTELHTYYDDRFDDRRHEADRLRRNYASVDGYPHRPLSASGYFHDSGNFRPSYDRQVFQRHWETENHHHQLYGSVSRSSLQSMDVDARQHYNFPYEDRARNYHPPPSDYQRPHDPSNPS